MHRRLDIGVFKPQSPELTATPINLFFELLLIPRKLTNHLLSYFFSERSIMTVAYARNEVLFDFLENTESLRNDEVVILLVLESLAHFVHAVVQLTDSLQKELFVLRTYLLLDEQLNKVRRVLLQ